MNENVDALMRVYTELVSACFEHVLGCTSPECGRTHRAPRWPEWLKGQGIHPSALEDDEALTFLLDSWLGMGRPEGEFTDWLATKGISIPLTDPAYERLQTSGTPTRPLYFGALEHGGVYTDSDDDDLDLWSTGRLTPIIPADDLPRHRIYKRPPRTVKPNRDKTQRPKLRGLRQERPMADAKP